MSVTQHLVKAADAAITQYLTFMVGDEAFGIGILSIREIIDYGTVTKVPMMPDSIRGVINLRGAVVPVMDLRARFDKGPSSITKRSCIVIVDPDATSGRPMMGVLVDAVNAVVDISAADVEPPPAFGAGVRTDFIHGMGKLDGRFVILLDVDHALSTAELSGRLASLTSAIAA